jgi:hypothetical protein
MVLASAEDWTRRAECTELVNWLYTVVQHRSRRVSESRTARADVCQDAMTAIVQALRTAASRDRLAHRDNPAAVLERIAERAVEAACHVHRMAGYSGVAPNGRNWRKAYPVRVGSDENLDSLAARRDGPIPMSGASVDAATERVRAWVEGQLGVTMTEPALDATVYVLDRIFAGLHRSSLMRGAHSGLSRDPAMAHLGIETSAAHAFGCWLLGRPDGKPPTPGVLDLALADGVADDLLAARWRRLAVVTGFGQVDHALRAPRAKAPTAPAVDVGLRLA